MFDEDVPEGRGRLRLKWVADVGMWTLAAFLAFPLRSPDRWTALGWSVVVYVTAGLPVYCILVTSFHLSRQSWRTVSLDDLQRLVIAVAIGTGIMFSVGLGLFRWLPAGFPRTVPLISGLLTLMLLAGVRILVRMWHEHRARGVPGESPTRVLLVGAGDAGRTIAREIQRHHGTGMIAVGFLDDDRSKAGLTFSGLRILGRLADLPAVVESHRVGEVLITIPSASGVLTRQVLEMATKAGVTCRILPGLTQILTRAVDINRIRNVEVEDLLRREAIEFGAVGRGEYIAGATVLVTGAGGSIGSELVRQVALLEPARVILYGHGENSLQSIQQELATSLPDLTFTVVLGDIRDQPKVSETMDRYRPDVIFHAAAHKHVPMMEKDPDEAVLNNIAGTWNVVECARSSGVKRFVNISTDKAVSPASILGATKIIAERVVRMVGTHASSGQAFVSVRFGNVLGSRGSVVPIFQEQILRGGPVTVTHPDMTRYFMTIPEASHLVIEAGALGVNGAVYVLDMGTPLKIVDLARDMIRLAGAEDDDIRIEFTGLRPGEKLHEQLFTLEEPFEETSHGQILVSYQTRQPKEGFRQRVENLLDAAERRAHDQIALQLRALVPGFDVGDALDIASHINGPVEAPFPAQEPM